MSNNKQNHIVEANKMVSSVELFAIALYDNGLLQGNGDEIDDLLVQFKAMHKEEIIDAHLEGQFDETEGYPLEIAKKFYNETYEQ